MKKLNTLFEQNGISNRHLPHILSKLTEIDTSTIDNYDTLSYSISNKHQTSSYAALTFYKPISQINEQQ